MIQTDFSATDLLFMLQGAGVTLALTFWAVLGGTLLGLVFGLLRAISPWWINAPIGAVLDVFRSIPLLIQFILANSFKSIIGLDISAFAVACVMLAPRKVLGKSAEAAAHIATAQLQQVGLGDKVDVYPAKA